MGIQAKRYGLVEAGGTKFVCGVSDAEGNLLERVSIPTTTPEETLSQVLDFFLSDDDLHALGVASFGPIDLDRRSSTYGYITSTPKAGWQNVDLLGPLRERFPIPIGFDTDVNGAALAECQWGAARSVSSCLYLTVGTGIGGGFASDGRTLQGLIHPEMGHVRVQQLPEDDYEGRCPFHGASCVEGLASGPAMEARWGQSAASLPEDHPAWQLEAEYLAQALVSMIVVLSPERIVLGGGVMHQAQLFPLIRERVRDLLAGYLQSSEILEPNERYIVPPGLGDNAGLLGALALAQAEEAK